MAEFRRVGNYEVGDRIGRGGMGAVYKARQINMDRIIALKILPPSLAKQPTFIERFLREARASAKLNHPNIVNGIDVGSHKGLYYFAMEYVEGRSLKDQIDADERIPEKRALVIAREIAMALDHAHSHGILHRDIKPENILIQKDGVSKLCDLGLAHLATESDIDKDLTQAGRAVGTPHYISPEQARGLDNLDATTDLYALGATLYHMVTGVTLFQGSTAVSIMSKHIGEKAVDPGEFGATLSLHFQQVLGKLLVKKSADRYSSAKKLVQDLERVSRGEAPKFAELDPAKWPFKSKPPANKGSGANGIGQVGVAKHRSDSGPYKNEKAEKSDPDQASKISIALSDRQPRVGRRGLRSGQESSVPAAVLMLGGVVLAVLLIALTQMSGSPDHPQKPRVAAAKDDAKAALTETPPAPEKPLQGARPPAQPPRLSATPAQPLDTGTMQELEELARVRAFGGGSNSVDAPQLIQTTVAVKPSIATCLVEARTRLESGEFKEALKRAEEIRRDFADSSDFSEYVSEIGRIMQAANDGIAEAEAKKALPSNELALKIAATQKAAVTPPAVPVAPIAAVTAKPDVKVADAPRPDEKKTDVKIKPDAPKPPPAKELVKKEEVVRTIDLLQQAMQHVNNAPPAGNGNGNGGNGNNSFFATGGDLAYAGNKAGAFDLTYQPPDAYDYKLSFKLDDSALRLSKFGFVMMYIPIEGKSLVWYMPYGNGVFAFDNINKTRFAESVNPTRIDHARLKMGSSYVAEIKVRHTTITVFLDGEIVGAWRRDTLTPTGDPDSKLNDPKNLGIGGMNRIGLHITAATATEYAPAK